MKTYVLLVLHVYMTKVPCKDYFTYLLQNAKKQKFWHGFIPDAVHLRKYIDEFSVLKEDNFVGLNIILQNLKANFYKVVYKGDKMGTMNFMQRKKDFRGGWCY